MRDSTIKSLEGSTEKHIAQVCHKGSDDQGRQKIEDLDAFELQYLKRQAKQQ